MSRGRGGVVVLFGTGHLQLAGRTDATAMSGFGGRRVDLDGDAKEAMGEGQFPGQLADALADDFWFGSEFGDGHCGDSGYGSQHARCTSSSVDRVLGELRGVHFLYPTVRRSDRWSRVPGSPS